MSRLFALFAMAALLAVGAAGAGPLPPAVQQELARARVPAQALAVVLQDANDGRVLLAWQEDRAMNPASLAKLVTTYAALDRFGPAWTWRTQVWLQGPVRAGRLDGDLVIRGSGDPTLVLERVWLLLRELRQAGVDAIDGDIVLDNSAFAVPAADPGEFDGEPLRPYNVLPDALMLNYKSLIVRFTPDEGQRQARVDVTPALAGAAAQAPLPLAAGPCGDWRAALKLAVDGDGRIRFGGAYPAACGERSWPLADPRPDSYNGRLLAGMWQEMGGRLAGRVRAGRARVDVAPSFEVESPPLAQVVRDINKFSNNTMARQLFYTLAAPTAEPWPPATPEAARTRLLDWLASIGMPATPTVQIDNGAGLSRQTRLSARQLAHLLQHAWRSPVMPEFVASLPVTATDGTLKRWRGGAGRGHLKTGSLRDSAGVAGYLLSQGGRRLILVALVNDEQANAARPALDALIQWAVDDAPGFERSPR